MKKVTFTDELKQLKEYIKSESTENAKRPLLYPLFGKLFGEKFKIESDAKGADVYVEGKLIVEAKTTQDDWLKGFYQALHYQKKFGLVYTTLVVIAHKFVAVWKVNQIPEQAVIISHQSNPVTAPNIIGSENAKRTSNVLKKEIQESAIYWLDPKSLSGNFFIDKGAKSIEYESFEILNILRNLDSDRIQINTSNFIQSIEYFKQFFVEPIDAVHCFYTIVAYWDITSVVSTNEYMDTFQVVGFKSHKLSEPVKINPNSFKELKKYIETHYIFTNEGSGLSVDYYFSRFDEVMAAIDPEYVKQHGIFFTDSNLSKFALWFANEKLPEKIGEDYIVFDPAGGSGNLVASWRGKLKHKIISELQPDLLRTIERRMRIDPWHVETGFTIIPKTSENKGLNFLEHSANEYYSIVEGYLKEKNLSLNKPLAFLMNPPYKNTDENEKIQVEKEAGYDIHPDIIDLCGNDAAKERYLAFLGQILNISKIQATKNLNPLILIFTPSSWLIPRPTYIEFRKTWDTHFEYIDGFVVKSNEFFKLQGAWPLAFSIWKYNYNETRENHIQIYDYTTLAKNDLLINWNLGREDLRFINETVLGEFKKVKFDNSKGDIRDLIPKLYFKGKKYIEQPRFNMYRNYQKSEESQKIVSGFPLLDTRHKNYKVPYGFVNGTFVGFMDDNTPIRLQQDTCNRMTNIPDRVWFMLMSSVSKVNVSQIHSGPANSRSYCAYNVESSKALFTWFSISKVIAGNYPLWANQYDIWSPKIKPKLKKKWYSLCYSYVLAVNSCVVTKFEKDNPVAGAPEVFVDNPLCPANPESFWATVLDKEVTQDHEPAFALVNKIKELYKTWNFNYCKGQFMYNVGLKDEPYFKYFDYADFLTPYSGLIQIKKHAQVENLADILDIFVDITKLTNLVKQEIYGLLVEEFRYFE